MNHYIVTVQVGGLGINAMGEVPLANTYVPVKAKDDERACVAAVRWHGDNDEVLKNERHQWYLEDSHRKVRYTALKVICVSDDELNEFLSFTQGLSKAIVVVDTQSAAHEEAEQIMSTIRHWQDSLVPLPTAETFSADARKFFGTEISHDDWSSLSIYLSEPTLDNWADIRDIMITPTRTIWQLMIDINPGTPLSGGEFTPGNVPTESELIEIFCSAVKQYNDHCWANISECQNRISELEAMMPE